MNDLPRGWSWRTMADVADVKSGSTPKTSEPSFWGGDIPWITPKDLSTHREKFIDGGSRAITDAGLSACSAQLLPTGTVLFSTRAPIGYVSIATRPMATNQGFKNFICGPEVSNDYVYWYLKGAKALAESMSSGTTFLELSGKAAAKLPIPVPPIQTQQAIVEEVEKQFTRLDAATDALRRSKANLVRYKSSILQSVTTGTLVESKRSDWAGHELHEIAQRVVDCEHSTAKFTSPGYPCVDTTCIAPGRILRDRLRFVDEATYRARTRRMVPEPGDVIFAREGTVGTAVVVPPDLQLCLGQRVMIIRPQPIVRSDFLEIALNSPATRNQYRSKILGTTAPHLNVMDVKRLVISLPSLDEQDALVEEAKKHVSVLEAAEQQIMRDLNRTERLRKSILSAAFSGELVR